MNTGNDSAASDSCEVTRVYYVMALRNLLPLALGYHYIRASDGDARREEHGASAVYSDLNGLECWLLQTQIETTGQEAAVSAINEIASSFVERSGVFGNSGPWANEVPAELIVVDHRVFDEATEEIESLGSATLDGTGLITVAIVGGEYGTGPDADSHWTRSFRLISEWVDSLRSAKAGPLPAITEVESIYPIYLRVVEIASGERDVRQCVIDTRNIGRGHYPVDREITNEAAWHFVQRRLGNPTTLIRDWTTKAFSARALGDHGQAIIYSAIAAEQAVRHIACVLQWESQRSSHRIDSTSLRPLFDKGIHDLLKKIGDGLGFEPNTKRIGCPAEILAWRGKVAEVRNHIMHVGHYPTGREADDAISALENLMDYLVSRIITSAQKYPISTLILCDPNRIPDAKARRHVLRYAESLDALVQEYSDSLSR